jgi:hypothetical protein
MIFTKFVSSRLKIDDQQEEEQLAEIIAAQIDARFERLTEHLVPFVDKTIVERMDLLAAKRSATVHGKQQENTPVPK